MRKRKAKIKETEPLVFDSFMSPESSNVEGGTYIPEAKEAVIAFRDKKNPTAETVFYDYRDVELGDWQNLKVSESKGRHMRNVFAKKYKGVLVE